jgi:ABC-type uncharacterized transport system permease subunit
MRKDRTKLAVPLVAVLLGFLTGSLIILITGKSPLGMVQAMVRTLT